MQKFKFETWQWAVLIGYFVLFSLVLGTLFVIVWNGNLLTQPLFENNETTSQIVDRGQGRTTLLVATKRPTYTPTPGPRITFTATPTKLTQFNPLDVPTNTPRPPSPEPETASDSLALSEAGQTNPAGQANTPVEPSATFTPPPTLSPTPSATPSPTALPSATPTPEPSPTVEPTSTMTPSPTPSTTLTVSINATAVDTLPQLNLGGIPTMNTATATATITPTAEPTNTNTATSTPTNTPTVTPAPMDTLTPTWTPTQTPSPTSTPTLMPTETATPTSISTSTNTPTPLPTQTLSPTRSPQVRSIINPSPTPDSLAIEVDTVSENSVSLRWDGQVEGQTYRVYSDMGSGYGIYIDQGDIVEPAFVDDTLQPGMTYSYRVEAIQAGESQALGTTSVILEPVQQPTTVPNTVSNDAANQNQTLSETTETTETAVQQSGLEVGSPVTIIPAPTPLPPDALLLGIMSEASYTDDFNTLNIAGEVRNDSNLDVGEVSVIVSFYDGPGTFLGEARETTLLKYLAPGQRAPFYLSLDRPVGMSNYSVKAVGRPVPPVLGPQLAAVSTKAYEDDIGFYHVSGTIQNQGSVPSANTKVIAILYGRGGGVINVGFTYPKPNQLNPGEAATFDIRFTYFPKVLNHEVMIVGN